MPSESGGALCLSSCTIVSAFCGAEENDFRGGRTDGLAALDSLPLVENCGASEARARKVEQLPEVCPSTLIPTYAFDRARRGGNSCRVLRDILLYYKVEHRHPIRLSRYAERAGSPHRGTAIGRLDRKTMGDRYSLFRSFGKLSELLQSQLERTSAGTVKRRAGPAFDSNCSYTAIGEQNKAENIKKQKTKEKEEEEGRKFTSDWHNVPAGAGLFD